MANIGLKTLYVALKNEDGTTIVDATKGLSETGVYAIDTNKSHMNLGAPPSTPKPRSQPRSAVR